MEQLGISDEKYAWIASIMPLGAALSMIFMALLFDIIGRKWLMIGIAPVFAFAWILLACCNSVILYCVARFFCGFCGGCFCVAAPNYTAELAEVSIRGLLGTLLQLMVCFGIATCYILGEVKNLHLLSLPCAVFPVILAISLLFLHDSPVFLLKTGREVSARNALQFFRGKDYDIEPEIMEMFKYIDSSTVDSTWEVFKRKSSLKASLMLLVLHVGYQTSGISTVMYFAHDIFEQAGSHIPSGTSSIILAVVQIIATAVCTGIADRLGRKLLLIISISLMMICLIILGVFFIVLKNDQKPQNQLGFYH